MTKKGTKEKKAKKGKKLIVRKERKARASRRTMKKMGRGMAMDTKKMEEMHGDEPI